MAFSIFFLLENWGMQKLCIRKWISSPEFPVKEEAKLSFVPQVT